jgi:hypothetical protein
MTDRKKPIQNFQPKEIESKNKDVIVKTLLNEHQRAEALALRLTGLYKTLEEALKAGKTAATDVNETADSAKNRLFNALKAVRDKLYTIDLTDTSHMVPNTSLTGSNLDQVKPHNDNDVEELLTQFQQLQLDDINKHKTYKLDVNTKNFSGLPGEKISTWLFIINDAFTAQGVPTDADKIKLSLVTNYLKGSAFNALMRYRRNENPTWTGFEDLLRAQYEDSNLDYKIRTQFYHLKMTDSFSKYLARFQELLNQMTNGNEADNETDILYKFTDGLVKEYALAVRRDKNVRNLNDAIKICQDIDCLSRNDINQHNESINKVKRINFSKVNNKSLNRTTRPFKRMMSNNSYSNRNNLPPFKKFKTNNSKVFGTNTKKIDLNNVTCYKCNTKGHYSSNCKKITNISNQKNKTNYKKSTKVFSIGVYTEVNDETNLLTIDGTLDGIPLKMTLDSGASTSVVSESFVMSHNLTILESDVMVKLAHNEVIKVLGKTKPLTVEVKGHTCILSMYILPNSEFDCLLGLNWFYKMKVSIAPAERTIKFQSETYSLDQNDPVFDNDTENILLANINTQDSDDINIVTEWDSNPFSGIKPETELTKNELKKVN